MKSTWIALIGAVVLASAVASAQTDRTQYFIDLLGSSTSFSVRAQAALALGRVTPSAQVRTALTAALRDEAPAVRAAAASAMERLADTQVLAALRTAEASERDATVRDAERRAIASLEAAGATPAAATATATGRTGTTPRTTGTPRYYVAIGVPGDNSSALPASELQALQQYITEQVGAVEGVVLAPSGESTAAGTSALRSNRLVGYYVDASVVSVEQAADGTTARVSVILATYPGRDMRAMLSGSARVPNARGPEAVRRAVQGAVQGSLRRLPQAMEASGARASR
ncbi:MAG: HEAT repeat domain-containing protein [Sandaracinaceae bacterium]|nr:HEAT repeat domain-containing protein [Sandaracinaceae bacterium]